MSSQMRNSGAYFKTEVGLLSATNLSSGSTERDGVVIDRLALARHYLSAKAVVAVQATLSTLNAITVTLNVQDSASTASTGFEDYSTATNVSQAIGSTGATGAQSIQDTVEQEVDLSGARRYIRMQALPTFTATTSGDNAVIWGVLVFGGPDVLPAQ